MLFVRLSCHTVITDISSLSSKRLSKLNKRRFEMIRSSVSYRWAGSLSVFSRGYLEISTFLHLLTFFSDNGEGSCEKEKKRTMNSNKCRTVKSLCFFKAIFKKFCYLLETRAAAAVVKLGFLSAPKYPPVLLNPGLHPHLRRLSYKMMETSYSFNSLPCPYVSLHLAGPPTPVSFLELVRERAVHIATVCTLCVC